MKMHWNLQLSLCTGNGVSAPPSLDLDNGDDLQKSWNALPQCWPQHDQYVEKPKEEIQGDLEELLAEWLPSADPPQ